MIRNSKLKALIAILTLFTLVFSSAFNATAEEGWRAAYKKFLKERLKVEIHDKSKGSMMGEYPLFFLYDLNSDGTPELIINMIYISSEPGYPLVYEYSPDTNSISRPDKYNSKLSIMESSEGIRPRYSLFDVFPELKKLAAEENELYYKTGFYDSGYDPFFDPRSETEAKEKINNAYNLIDYNIDNYKPVLPLTQVTAKLTINGVPKNFSQPVYTLNGRQLYPLRELADMLGAATNWDSATKTATCTLGQNTVSFVIDSNTYTVNGNAEQMENSITPLVINGSTYIPIRYTVEGLGMVAGWDAATGTVIINH